MPSLSFVFLPWARSLVEWVSGFWVLGEGRDNLVDIIYRGGSNPAVVFTFWEEII